ncbi:hypothetical protein Tco_0240773 [Tanacetum coccineum]
MRTAKVVRKNNGALVTEEWVSDSKDEDELMPKIEKKTVKPSFAKIEFVKSKEQVKSPRKTIVKQGSNFEMINKACYECGRFDHLQITHPSPKRNMVPKAVLMRSGLVSLTTARPVNTAQPRTTVNSGNPHMDLQDKGVIDSGCSRHMTGNMSYLTDFEEIDGGCVTFGVNSKGGKITSKGTKACDDAGKARMEIVLGKDYIMLPLWIADPSFSQSLKSSPDAGFKPSGDDEKKLLLLVLKNTAFKLPNESNMPETDELSIQMMMKMLVAEAA